MTAETLDHSVADEAADDIDEAEPDNQRTAYADADADAPTTPPPRHRRNRTRLVRILTFVVMPLLAMTFAAAAGYFKYIDTTAADTIPARIEATAAARDGATAMFSYTPDTVEQSLTAATEYLTGPFRDEYTTLINTVAIPGAKQYDVTTSVNIPAVAVVRADPNHVVVVLFVNQTVKMGDQPPADTAFSARTTLDRVDDRWLISAFEPI